MKTIITLLVLIGITGCQTTKNNPVNVLGNNITFQHGKDKISIDKANSDALSQCMSLGYTKAKVSFTNCTNECVSTFICE